MLTEEDLRQKEEDAESQLDELRQQGMIVAEEPGITRFRSADSDDGWDELQSFLDGQTNDIDRAIQKSLEDGGDFEEPL